MTTFLNGGVLLIRLDSRLDTANAAEIDKLITDAVEKNRPQNVIVDADALEYISSVGLRVLLKLMKRVPNTQVVNVSPQVYDVFEMTGFTDILDVKRAFRRISVEGCRVIGRGTFATTYKLSSDSIVKVFHPGVCFDDITREKESAKAAFVCGVPTAIPFDTVRVGDSYGNVYELINARPLSEAICEQPQRMEDFAKMAAGLLQTLSETHDERGAFSSFAGSMLEHLKNLNRYIPGLSLFSAEELELLERLYSAVPERDTIVHGDFHTHNIFIQDGELVLIDMADSGRGHPIFELGNMYLTFVFLAERTDESTRLLIGLDNFTSIKFFKTLFEIRFGGWSAEDKESLRELLRIFARLRMVWTAAASGMCGMPAELVRNYLLGMKVLLKTNYFSKPDEVLSEVKRLTAMF